MYCYNCSQEIINDGYKFCPKCGTNLKDNTSKNQTIKLGSNSINIGGNGDNNQYHINGLDYNATEKQTVIRYNKDKINKLPYDIKKASIFSVILTVVSFLGSMASIIGIFKDSTFSQENTWIQLIWISATLLGLSLLYFFSTLKKQEFKGIYTFFGKLLFWLDKKTGEIYRIKVYSKCPKCGSDVNIRKIKDKEKYIGVCDRNLNHKFAFDHTDFTGEPIFIEEIEIKIS